MNILIVVLVVALVLIFWPGASELMLRAFVKVFGEYDDSMFRARDFAADQTQARRNRTIAKLRYRLMIGVPLVILFALMMFAEFGKFLKPLSRAILGTP